jgi:hypothetical protein
MSRVLEEVKDRLRQLFVGKGGIHGVGISEAKKAIRVYIDRDAGTDQGPLLEQVRASAAPFPVILVQEDRPKAH